MLIRDAILLQALPEVVFDGWTQDLSRRAAAGAGYDPAMVDAVFPGGVSDFVGHFSDWADRQMLASLANTDRDALRIRDRVKCGVMARLEALAPWREPARRAMTYWAMPLRHFQAGKIVWRSADHIWVWAGDTATDYNHYTKRALLSGVITSTTLAWLNDDHSTVASVESFLDRRLDSVLRLGQVLGCKKKSA